MCRFGPRSASLGAHGVAHLFRDMEKQYGASLATGILSAYNNALQKCFMVCIILLASTLLGAFGMEWISVKADSKAKPLQESPSGPMNMLPG